MDRLQTPPLLERWGADFPRPTKRPTRPRSVPLYPYKTDEERNLEKIRWTFHDGPLSPSSQAYRVRSTNEKEQRVKDGCMDFLEADNAAMEEIITEGEQLLAKGNLDAFANLIEDHNKSGKGGGGSALLRYLSKGSGVTGIKHKDSTAYVKNNTQYRKQVTTSSLGGTDTPRSMISSEGSVFSSMGSQQGSDGGFTHAPVLRFRSSMPGSGFTSEEKQRPKDIDEILAEKELEALHREKDTSTEAPRSVVITEPPQSTAQLIQRRRKAEQAATPGGAVGSVGGGPLTYAEKRRNKVERLKTKPNYRSLLQEQEKLEETRLATEQQYKYMLKCYHEAQENSQKALDLIIAYIPDADDASQSMSMHPESTRAHPMITDRKDLLLPNLPKRNGSLLFADDEDVESDQMSTSFNLDQFEALL